jgi:thiol:disulfide interchange protein DsbD
MKKFITFFILLLTIISQAQTADEPIKLETSVQKISETEYDIIFSAKLYKGWYL